MKTKGYGLENSQIQGGWGEVRRSPKASTAWLIFNPYSIRSSLPPSVGGWDVMVWLTLTWGIPRQQLVDSQVDFEDYLLW